MRGCWVAASVVVLAGCTHDTRTSTATRVTSITVAANHECKRPANSPGTYDPARGVYAVYLTTIDAPHRQLTFDVIQWLSGDAAVAAYHRESPEDSNGPPNDYMIVNASPQTYTAQVASNATVGLVRLATTGSAAVKAGTFEELPSYVDVNARIAGPDFLSTTVFWLTLSDHRVVDICEQYRP